MEGKFHISYRYHNIRLSLAFNHLLSVEMEVHHLTNQQIHQFLFYHGTLKPKRQKSSMFGGTDFGRMHTKKVEIRFFFLFEAAGKDYRLGEETV